MQITAQQTFSLVHPAGQAAALAFIRSPDAALRGVHFLRGLEVLGSTVSGELVVVVPVLGEVDLPFRSQVHETPTGAELRPEPLSGERAWIEVAGQATAEGDGSMQFAFQFRAHLHLSGDDDVAQHWGSAAFAKMVQAAAARTLTRLTSELPRGIAAGMVPSQPPSTATSPA
ncbi:DUF3809 domain-containing protein [Deinococcus lacus]|uniref:DUF3809 domain-containing protein n=1 Tax=Deinococcus lacus TaxID=392561 RepID=A0ABW1YAL7_9DEIO